MAEQNNTIMARNLHRVIIKAEQLTSSPPSRHEYDNLSEDHIHAKFIYYKIAGTFSCGHRDRPMVWTDPHNGVGEQEFWFHFPSFKPADENISCNPKYVRKCRREISRSLRRMGVAKDEHDKVVNKFLEVAATATSADVPILVAVWETDMLILCDENSWLIIRSLSLDFGTRSSTCSICLEDFEEPNDGGGGEQLVPCLPCSHQFHLQCIFRCMETKHTCPVCCCPISGRRGMKRKMDQDAEIGLRRIKSKLD